MQTKSLIIASLGYLLLFDPDILYTLNSLVVTYCVRLQYVFEFFMAAEGSVIALVQCYGVYKLLYNAQLSRATQFNGALAKKEE